MNIQIVQTVRIQDKYEINQTSLNYFCVSVVRLWTSWVAYSIIQCPDLYFRRIAVCSL